MTYPTASTTVDVEELADVVDSLRRRLDQLDSTVNQEHAERLYELENDYRLEELRGQVERLDDRADDHDDQVASVRTELRRLTGQVRWLEYHMRAERGLEPVDLDRVPDTWAQLARHVRIGDTARASLLTEQHRRYLRGEIDRYNSVASQARQKETQTLQHSKTIATSTPGSAAHTSAAAGFRAARAELDQLYQQAERLRQRALDAAAELEADDALRTKVGPQIMRAERARPQLLAKLRDRIGKCVRRHELFPGWFTAAFGYRPPSDRTEAWTRLAVDVLAYRLVWDVTDQVAALGDPPAYDAAHGARYAEYQSLASRLADMRL
ncbi:hypothetical protein [Actinomadura keratinilytica]|uniref:CHAD domain-containing protein n=1 Tax=Actinomadura keratinilytica TaxID=547461 RepID=A0ABP7ZID1_9ACTN